MLLPLFSAPCFLSSFLLGSFSCFLPTLLSFHPPPPCFLPSFLFLPFHRSFFVPFPLLISFSLSLFPPLLLVFFPCFLTSVLSFSLSFFFSLFHFLLSLLCPFLLHLLVSFPFLLHLLVSFLSSSPCFLPSLLLQDNFGFDLQAVEAATKKHEAIETDIAAYEERVQVSSTG